MSVRVARHASFCMGVKRALDTVLHARRKYSGTIYTYGSLIHNTQVLEALERIDIRPLDENAEPGSPVVVRAHGITPEERKSLKERGFIVIDATCPRVGQVHALAKKTSKDGERVIILGDRDHVEVKGILGYCSEGGEVVSSLEEISNLSPSESAVILFQTTFSQADASQFVEKIREKIPQLLVHDTICDATEIRQNEVKLLAAACDAVVVVGGKNSANTARLAKIAKNEGTDSFHIETEDDIPEEIKNYDRVGITAGASTPYWMFHRVQERVWESRLSGWKRPFWSILSFLVRSHLMVGLAAFCLAFSIDMLLELHSIVFPVIAALYIFGIHIVNSYTVGEASTINEPAQQLFLKRYRYVLLPASFIASVLVILFAVTVSPTCLLIASSSVLLGALYQMRIPFAGFRIKDFPGSKDLFTSSAWAFLTVLLPVWSEGRLNFNTWMTVFVIFLILLVRSLLYDVKDIQGDRIVGRETIPVILGKRNTQFLAIVMTLVAIVTIVLLLPDLMVLIILPLYTLVILYLYHRRVFVGGIRFNLIVDGIYVLLPFLLTLASM